MRHNKFKIKFLFLCLFFLISVPNCENKIVEFPLVEKDLIPIQMKPEWIIKNLNFIFYETNHKDSKTRFIALLYKAVYSKNAQKIYISFHPIWTTKKKLDFIKNTFFYKLFDPIDAFLIVITLNKNLEADCELILIKSKYQNKFTEYPKSKIALFSKDKFSSNTRPITIHLTFDKKNNLFYPGFREEIFHEKSKKIITNPVSSGKIVTGLSEFISDEEDKSYYLGYFTENVWDEYFMNSIFNRSKIFLFEKSNSPPILWPE